MNPHDHGAAKRALEGFLREMAVSQVPLNERMADALNLRIFQEGFDASLPAPAADMLAAFCQRYFQSDFLEASSKDAVESLAGWDDFLCIEAFEALMALKDAVESCILDEAKQAGG